MDLLFTIYTCKNIWKYIAWYICVILIYSVRWFNIVAWKDIILQKFKWMLHELSPVIAFNYEYQLEAIHGAHILYLIVKINLKLI